MVCCGKRQFLAALLSVLLLHLCSESEAYSTFDCCLGYTNHVVPTSRIVGFTQQLAIEGCDIDAVVFHTKRRMLVCADPKKSWVKNAVHVVSQRVKKM